MTFNFETKKQRKKYFVKKRFFSRFKAKTKRKVERNRDYLKRGSKVLLKMFLKKKYFLN